MEVDVKGGVCIQMVKLPFSNEDSKGCFGFSPYIVCCCPTSFSVSLRSLSFPQVQHEIDTIPVDSVSTTALPGQATGAVVFEALRVSSWRRDANQAPNEWCQAFLVSAPIF